MRKRLIFMCWLGLMAIIPTMAFAIKGVTCTNGSAYYCVRNAVRLAVFRVRERDALCQ